jgi:hypothetical protein
MVTAGGLLALGETVILVGSTSTLAVARLFDEEAVRTIAPFVLGLSAAGSYSHAGTRDARARRDAQGPGLS